MTERTSASCALAALTAVAALALGAAPAHATGSPTGNSIIGIFSNPILSGSLLTSPTTTTFQNNGSTAVTSGVGTSTLTWGTTDGQLPNASNSSSLTFTGSTNLLLDALSPVQVGTITYSNGGSSTDTLIFGATLSFYFNSVSPSTLLGSDTVYINTTSNTFSAPGLTPSQLATDADYVNICGNSSNICGTSVDSFEAVEVNGYTPFIADLNATYLGDPSITLTSVTADPASKGTGDIGSRPALAAPPSTVPEPGSLGLLLAGLLGLGAAVGGRLRAFRGVPAR